MSLLRSPTFNNIDFTISSKGITFDNEGGKKLFVPAHSIRGVELNDGKINIGLSDDRFITLIEYANINTTFEKIINGL